MIVYNITLKVSNKIKEEWLRWMQQEHIRDMLGTGLFSDYRLCRLLEQDSSEDATFVIQYHCDSIENYQSYLKEHAEAMRRKGISKFGDKVLAFRTLMEIVE